MAWGNISLFKMAHSGVLMGIGPGGKEGAVASQIQAKCSEKIGQNSREFGQKRSEKNTGHRKQKKLSSVYILQSRCKLNKGSLMPKVEVSVYRAL